MATREEIVKLIYEADNRKLVQALKEQHNLDDKATKQLAKELKKRETKATRVAAKIAKAQERASEAGRRAVAQANKDKIESFKKFGEAAQGSIGATTGRVFALGEGITKFAGAAGPVGIASLAIAGLGVAGVASFVAISGAVAGASVALVKFMQQAEETLEELRPLYELGALEVINEDQRNAIIAFNQDMKGLGAIIQSISVEVAANLGPQLEQVSHIILTLGFLIADMAKNWIQAGSLINRAITYSLINPLQNVVTTWQGIILAVSRSFAPMAKALGYDFPAMADVAIDKMEGFKGLMHAVASDEVEKRLGQLSEAVNGIGGSFGEARAKAYALRASINLVAAGAGEVSKKIEKIEQPKEQPKKLKKQLDQIKKFEDERVSISAEASDMISAMRENEAQQLTDAYFKTGGAIIGATQSLAAFADAQARQARDGTEAQKRAAKTAFAISQSAGIAQITITTAQAVMQALASLPVPFGAIAAGAAAATGAAQLATVMSAPAPSFHTGGGIGNASMAPDEVNIRAKSGEGVLSSRGMDAIGGRDGLRAANRGQRRGEEIVVVQKYQHRSFGAFAEDNVRMTNSPIRKAIKRRRRVGHR